MTAKDIRNDIVTRLLNNTVAGTNVSSANIDPAMLANLPAIVVFTPNRSAVNIDHTSLSFNKNITIELTCIVGNLTTFSDDIDDLIEEIKTTLFTDKAWYSQFDGNIEEYNEEIVLHSEGETHFATGTLTFSTLQTVEKWN